MILSPQSLTVSTFEIENAYFVKSDRPNSEIKLNSVAPGTRDFNKSAYSEKLTFSISL